MAGVDISNAKRDKLMKHTKTYRVSELSRLAGVSVRTLHHYDDVGLLTPWRNDNGYREYDQNHVVRLQQIIIYRALDFSIDKIAELLDAAVGDQMAALESQKAMLLERQRQTQIMIDSIEVSMKSNQTKKNMDILFEGLPRERLDSFHQSMEEKAGVEIESVYQEAFGNLSSEEAKSVKQEGDDIVESFVSVIHLPVDSPEVQRVAERHHQMSERTVKAMRPEIEFGYEAAVKAATMLATDEAAREFYSFYHENYAEKMGEALLYYAETNLKHL